MSLGQKQGLSVLLTLLALARGVIALDCGDELIRGVNLGGWLLLEPWITPVFFEEVNVGNNSGLIVDEWTYAQYLEPDFGMQRKIR